jgi:hypothetical protein
MKQPIWPLILILLSNGFTLPDDVLVDPSFADLSAEEIYSRLIQRKSDGANAPQQSPQPPGGVSKPELMICLFSFQALRTEVSGHLGGA